MELGSAIGNVFDERSTVATDAEISVQESSFLIGLRADSSTETIVVEALACQKPFVIISTTTVIVRNDHAGTTNPGQRRFIMGGGRLCFPQGHRQAGGFFGSVLFLVRINVMSCDTLAGNRISKKQAAATL